MKFNIDNVDVYNLEKAIKTSGYAMQTEIDTNLELNEKDLKRAKYLGTTDGISGHCCYLKGVLVTFDLTAPHYWLPQFMRYHFADIITSQSKMHRITKFDIKSQCNQYTDERITSISEEYTKQYLEDQTKENFLKLCANLPQGLMLTAGITTNYLQLKNIYHQRKNHKLEEWQIFCSWIETLPMFKEIVLGEKHE